MINIERNKKYRGIDKEGNPFIGILVTDLYMEQGGYYCILDNTKGDSKQVAAHTLEELIDLKIL